jgi:hypothetical protein
MKKKPSAIADGFFLWAIERRREPNDSHQRLKHAPHHPLLIRCRLEFTRILSKRKWHP